MAGKNLDPFKGFDVSKVGMGHSFREGSYRTGKAVGLKGQLSKMRRAGMKTTTKNLSKKNIEQMHDLIAKHLKTNATGTKTLNRHQRLQILDEGYKLMKSNQGFSREDMKDLRSLVKQMGTAQPAAPKASALPKREPRQAPTNRLQPQTQQPHLKSTNDLLQKVRQKEEARDAWHKPETVTNTQKTEEQQKTPPTSKRRSLADQQKEFENATAHDAQRQHIELQRQKPFLTAEHSKKSTATQPEQTIVKQQSEQQQDDNQQKQDQQHKVNRADMKEDLNDDQKKELAQPDRVTVTDQPVQNDDDSSDHFASASIPRVADMNTTPIEQQPEQPSSIPDASEAVDMMID